MRQVAVGIIGVTDRPLAVAGDGIAQGKAAVDGLLNIFRPDQPRERIVHEITVLAALLYPA